MASPLNILLHLTSGMVPASSVSGEWKAPAVRFAIGLGIIYEGGAGYGMGTPSYGGDERCGMSLSGTCTYVLYHAHSALAHLHQR